MRASHGAFVDDDLRLCARVCSLCVRVTVCSSACGASSGAFVDDDLRLCVRVRALCALCVCVTASKG